MQLHLSVVADPDAPLTVRTRPDGTAELGLTGRADVRVLAEHAELVDFARSLMNAGGLGAARLSLALARRPEPTPA